MLEGSHPATTRYPALRTLLTTGILVMALLFGPTVLRAQKGAVTAPAPASDTIFQADDFLRNLPPLETLIDSALAHAPAIKGQDLNIERSKLAVRRTRNAWTTDIVNAGGGLSYGQLNDLYMSDGGQSTVSNSAQTRYSVGMSVKIPVSAFLNRTESKTAKVELKLAENQKQQTINDIREEVYSRYNSLLANYDGYKILFENFEDQEVILQHAEKDFLNNQITVADLSNTRVSYSRARIDLSKARYEFERSRWVLEDLVGFRIGH